MNSAGKMQEYDASTGQYGKSNGSRDYDAEIKELQAQKRQYSLFSQEGKELRNKINQLIAERDGYNSYEEMQEKKHQEALEREKILNEQKLKEQKQEQSKEDDYRMAHRPTESGVYADNLINQDTETPAPKDLYDHPQYYMNLNNQADKESFEALKRVRNKPNATIKIYRATTGDTINNGDWITLSKTYAEEHNSHSLDGKGKIIEMDVPVRDIQWAMDSINEWGYYPKETPFEKGLKKGLNIEE